MSNLNYNETGQLIRVNAGKDITAATPSLALLPEVGVKKVIVDGVSIPLVDAEVGNDTYYAGEYIEYTTLDDDLDYAGRWKKKAFLEYSAGNIEQTDYVKFRVMP